MHHLQSEKDVNLLMTLKKNGYHIYFGGKNDVFKEDVPLGLYCDYRSDAYKEMACLAKGERLPEGYARILKQYTKEQAMEAERIKERARREPDGKYYYSLYQGSQPKDNPLAAGYVGAEDAQIADAVRYIRDYKGKAPLCVYLSLILPHPPYTAWKEDYAAIDRRKVKPAVRLTSGQLEKKPAIIRGMRRNHRLYQWSEEELLDFKLTYAAMVRHIDRNFGKVMDSLREKEIYDDTMVFLFSDHGDYAGDYEIAEINANTFEDVLTNVPLIIKPQNGVPIKSGCRHSLVELVDIPRTVAELAGISLLEDDCGRSLVHLLSQEEEHRDFVIAEGGRLEHEIQCMDGNHTKDNPYWARTSEQMKMPQHTKAVMIRDRRYKYVCRLYEQDEFYDLERDPCECENQINNREYADAVRKCKDRLLYKMIETCDYVPRKTDRRS
jgi:arylsulfatase A-like enzyme